MKLYCMYDNVAEESGMLFEARNDFMAHRIFDNVTEWPQGASKKDFSLLKLGSYFHGNEFEKPKVMGLSKSEDITRVAQKNDGLMPEEKEIDDVA